MIIPALDPEGIAVAVGRESAPTVRTPKRGVDREAVEDM